MRKRSRGFFIAVLFCLLPAICAKAQQTQIDTDPAAVFNKGKELFDNRFYGAAEQAFKSYLNTKDNNEALRADAQYYIAISAMELFQDNAEALLNEFTTNYPVNPKARLANYYLGKFEWREKNWAKAISSFEKVDASDLSDKEALEFYWMKGYALYQKKDYAAARQNLAKVKDVPGDNKAYASFYYGNIEYMKGNYKDALIEFEKIKNDKKFKTVIPVYITQIYLLQGKYDKVIAAGEEALKDKTTEKNDEIKLYVAEAWFMQKDYTKAAELYKQYNGSLNPHHSYQFGYCLMKLEQYNDAINAFNQVPVNEDSLGQSVSYNLGSAYIKTGEKEKALTAYQFASSLSFIPIVKEISLLNYAKLSYELNNTKDAIDGFKQFLKDYPDAKHAEEAREILSQILITSESPKEALDIIESIPKRSKRLEEAYQRILYLYGMNLYKNHKIEDALDYFAKSLQHPSDRKIKALASFWAGECRYNMGDYDKAMANYKNFLAIDEAEETPYFNVCYYNIGYCQFKNESYVDAKTYFNKYLELDKANRKTSRYTDAILRKADCSFVLKDYDVAMQGYQAIIDNHTPETDYALYQKGLIMGLQDNDDEKINVLRQVSKSSPLADDAEFAIAETYKNQEKYQKAIQEYRALNYNYPKNPYIVTALFNIGQCYINMGQDDKGVAVFKSINAQYPQNALARLAAKSIQYNYVQRGLTDSVDVFLANNPGARTGGDADSILYASAFSNVKNDDCDAATKSLKKYLSKYPNGFFTVDAHYYIGDCEMNAGSRAAAIEDFNYVIAKTPNSYMEKALKSNAGLYYEDKNYTMALQRYKQLEEIANEKQNVLLAMNGELRAAFFLNKYDETIETGNKILNLAYADATSKHEAQFFIAKSQLELNQLDQALPNFEQVYKTDESDMGAEAMYQASYINYTQNKYKEAQDIIFALNRSDMSDYWKVKALILLSDIYVKTGDDFQAKSTLKTIIDKYDGVELKKIATEKYQQIKDREAKKKTEGGDNGDDNKNKEENQ